LFFFLYFLFFILLFWVFFVVVAAGVELGAGRGVEASAPWPSMAIGAAGDLLQPSRPRTRRHQKAAQSARGGLATTS